ncbi:MAG: Uma2 family endonuclease [Chloracidobacterium sp.]|nr:Uma2 family endonuclease [Chloracidobacterium sp.]
MSEKAMERPSVKGVAEEYSGLERSRFAGDTGSGRLIARSGSNRWHNLIVANTAISAGSKMHGHKAEIYISNMRLRLANNLFCYPDIVIVSGEPKFADPNQDLLLNPTVVIEIFSSSTNTSDKTKKVESFLEMSCIKECLLLKEDEMRVEHYSRQNAKQWLYRIYNERDDVVSLDSVGCKISLSEMYAQIKFPQTQFASKAVN